LRWQTRRYRWQRQRIETHIAGFELLGRLADQNGQCIDALPQLLPQRRNRGIDRRDRGRLLRHIQRRGGTDIGLELQVVQDRLRVLEVLLRNL
jgi:hypothetical protein